MIKLVQPSPWIHIRVCAHPFCHARAQHLTSSALAPMRRGKTRTSARASLQSRREQGLASDRPFHGIRCRCFSFRPALRRFLALEPRRRSRIPSRVCVRDLPSSAFSRLPRRLRRRLRRGSPAYRLSNIAAQAGGGFARIRRLRRVERPSWLRFRYPDRTAAADVNHAHAHEHEQGLAARASMWTWTWTCADVLERKRKRGNASATLAPRRPLR